MTHANEQAGSGPPYHSYAMTKTFIIPAKVASATVKTGKLGAAPKAAKPVKAIKAIKAPSVAEPTAAQPDWALYKERQRQRVAEAGGKQIALYVQAESVADIERIMARDGVK